MKNKTKTFRYLLSQDDWIDVRITKDIEANKIIKFSLNLSSIIKEKAYPVIRYDNAHGYTHIDRYWTRRKEKLTNLSMEDVIQMARKDLVSNWKKYRKKVEKKLEMVKMDEAVQMNVSTIDDFFNIIEGVITDPDNFDKLPDNMIFAKDYETLHKILTEKRLELIEIILHNPDKNISSIAKILKRKRESISRDISILESLGIVNVKKKGRSKIPRLSKQYIVVPLV